jgi:hypothetical protein
LRTRLRGRSKPAAASCLCGPKYCGSWGRWIEPCTRPWPPLAQRRRPGRVGSVHVVPPCTDARIQLISLGPRRSGLRVRVRRRASHPRPGRTAATSRQRRRLLARAYRRALPRRCGGRFRHRGWNSGDGRGGTRPPPTDQASRTPAPGATAQPLTERCLGM